MHKKILEAALFTSSRPLSMKELSEITGISSLGSLKTMLKELQNEYEERGLEIIETPNGEWHMQVKKDILPKVAHLTPYSDLSEGCKRTLALVVYKEPVSQSEIIKIQGNKAYGYIKELEKRGLIKTYKKSRTRIIELTQEFENYFGEEKEKIKHMMEEKLGAIGKDKREQIMEEIEKEISSKEVKPEDIKETPSEEIEDVKELQTVENIINESAEKVIEKTEVEVLKETPVQKPEKEEAETTEEKRKTKETAKEKQKSKKTKKRSTGKVLVWTRNSG
jgi:segregation and condensation protein B